jgi:hypothetical protein
VSVGPLRRLAGCVGLLALTPTAVMLVLERVTLVDAAIRAGVTLAVISLLARVAGWWLSLVAGGLEQEDDADSGAAAYGRRVTDQPEAPAAR